MMHERLCGAEIASMCGVVVKIRQVRTDRQTDGFSVYMYDCDSPSIPLNFGTSNYLAPYNYHIRT